MATRWAVANGNWSDPATWDGGTLPGADDDVYADGKTVTIDQSATVTTIRTTQRSGGTVGGGFVLNAGVTFTATNPLASGGGVICGAFGAALTYAANSGSSTINSDLKGGGIGSSRAVDVTGTGTLSVVGAYSAGISILDNALTVSGAATVSVTGAGMGLSTAPSYGSHGILISGAATVTVTGAVTGSTVSTQSYGIYITTQSTLAVIGAVTAVTAPAINSAVASTITVTGPLTASTAVPALSSSHISAVNKLSGPFINTNGTMAVYAQKMYLTDTTANRWEFTTDVGTQRNLYSADSIGGNPAVADVRIGTTFGPANELTGVCAVPPAASVNYGVPVDHTTGTALLDASAIASALNASTLASDYTALASDYTALASDYTTLAADVGTLQSDVSDISARILEQIPEETPAILIPMQLGPTMTIAWIRCYDEHGQLESGVIIHIKLISVSNNGIAYDGAIIETQTNADGIAATQIPRGTGLQFVARRGWTGNWVPFSGVNAEFLKLPALLGIP